MRRDIDWVQFNEMESRWREWDKRVAAATPKAIEFEDDVEALKWVADYRHFLRQTAQSAKKRCSEIFSPSSPPAQVQDREHHKALYAITLLTLRDLEALLQECLLDLDIPPREIARRAQETLREADQYAPMVRLPAALGTASGMIWLYWTWLLGSIAEPDFTRGSGKHWAVTRPSAVRFPEKSRWPSLIKGLAIVSRRC